MVEEDVVMVEGVKEMHAEVINFAVESASKAPSHFIL